MVIREGIFRLSYFIYSVVTGRQDTCSTKNCKIEVKTCTSKYSLELLLLNSFLLQRCKCKDKSDHQFSGSHYYMPSVQQIIIDTLLHAKQPQFRKKVGQLKLRFSRDLNPTTARSAYKSVVFCQNYMRCEMLHFII